MTIPADQRTANIRLSFQAAVGNVLTVNTVDGTGNPRVATVPVYWRWPWADPESARTPATPTEDAFVVGRCLSEGAGRRGWTRVQIDCYSRIGAHGSTTGDPFGVAADDIADEIEDKFRGQDPVTGNLRAWVRVNDYAVPAAPVQSDGFLYVMDPGTTNGWGLPEDRTVQPDGDYRRVILRFSFRLDTDHAGMLYT